MISFLISWAAYLKSAYYNYLSALIEYLYVKNVFEPWNIFYTTFIFLMYLYLPYLYLIPYLYPYLYLLTINVNKEVENKQMTTIKIKFSVYHYKIYLKRVFENSIFINWMVMKTLLFVIWFVCKTFLIYFKNICFLFEFTLFYFLLMEILYWIRQVYVQLSHYCK